MFPCRGRPDPQIFYTSSREVIDGEPYLKWLREAVADLYGGAEGIRGG
jgi:hypothetical protein